MTTELRRSTPSAEGVDASGVTELLDALDADPDIRMHALVLLRHGAVVAEGGWAPYRTDRVQLLYSLSKSFTSTAAALARAEGLLDLDAPVLDYFPEYVDEIADPRMRRMTVRNIASMASGHAEETLDRAVAAGDGDIVLGFLRTPLDAEPGTVFAYNQPCTYTLAAIVQRAAGQTLVEYLRPRLLDPLGITEASWTEHPAGFDLGFSGLHATTEAVARLGQLYLQGGRWGGVQLIDEDWVAEATRVQVANPGDWGADWSQGYGLQFWMSRHGYRGDGAFGQFCVVLPEQDLVLAITSETVEMQRVLDLVWRHLLPAVDGRTDADADAELASRLAAGAFPLPAAAAPPADPGAWSASAFPVASTGRPAGGIREVRLREADGDWSLGLVDADGELVFALGVGRWLESTADGVPAAVAGGWDADGFSAEVLLLDTPHSLRIVCRADGTALVRWVTPSLEDDEVRRQRKP